MTELIIGVAGYRGLNTDMGLRDSCAMGLLALGLIFICLAAYQLYKVSDPERIFDR